jgi:uncharacterized membrane protein
LLLGLLLLRALQPKERRRMRAALEHERIQNNASQHACRCHKDNDAPGATQQKGKATWARLLHRAATRGLCKNEIMIGSGQSFPHGEYLSKPQRECLAIHSPLFHLEVAGRSTSMAFHRAFVGLS